MTQHTRDRKPSIERTSGHRSLDSSIFVTRKIKHNTFQYYAWKIAYVASLVVEHAWICWDLAKKLFNFLIAGTRVWVFMVARLFGFITILMPGWAALLRYYCFDSFIIRNIDFGKGPRRRNLLDVYLPMPSNPRKSKHRKGKRRPQEGASSSSISQFRSQGKAPVIVFVSGGAWIIGYKLWSGLMARELSRAGYVVVVPDYRNFPQGNIKDMITDLRAALLWTTMNCAMFGGDPEQIILAGQSAGAHISMCTVVELYEEYLARELIKKSTSATINLRNRTVHLRNLVRPTNGYEEEEEDQDNLSDCIWRDAVSEINKTIDGGSELEDSSYADLEGDNDNEDTDEEEITVINDTPEVGSVSSSYEDQRTSLNLSHDRVRHATMSFPTDSSDFMEYKVSQQDNIEDIDTGDNINNEKQSREDRHSPINMSASSHTDDFDEHVLKISDIKMFIGISGPYNMEGLMHHLHTRGLDVSILHYIFAFDVKKYSPTVRLAKIMGKQLTNTLSLQCLSLEESSLSIYKYLFGGGDTSDAESAKLPRNRINSDDSSDDEHDEEFHHYDLKHSMSETCIEDYVIDQLHNGKQCTDTEVHPVEYVSKHTSTSADAAGVAVPSVKESIPHLLNNFPTVALFHGSKDKSIPSMVSDELEALLLSGNAKVTSKIYKDMSHTDPILENVLEGNIELVVDMINSIESNIDLKNSRDCVIDAAVLKKNQKDGDEKSVNSDRCERYLHNNKTVSWPISKGMMKIARMMNPF